MLNLFRLQLRPPPCATFTEAMREKHRKSTKLKIRLLTRRMKLRKLAKLGLTLEDLNKKETFAERMAKFRAKSGSGQLSESLVWPSRELPIRTIAPPPKHQVYRISEYDQTVSLFDAIQMNRELQHPTMYNNPKVQLVLRLDLNMNLDEENKTFVENLSKIITLPHKFNLMSKRTVMAFAADKEQLEKARDAGAEFLCAEDSIKKVLKGHLKIDDVDYFVASTDIIKEMSVLRGLLKNKFPTALNGGLGLDIAERVQFFRTGILLEIKRDENKPIWGVSKSPIGTLDQPAEHLEENIKTYVDTVCSYRPLAKSLGHFISRAVVYVNEFAKEYHVIDFTKYAPPVPDHDQNIETTAEKGKKKGKKKKGKEKDLLAQEMAAVLPST